MSEGGQCWDNAPVESFFEHPKLEIGVERFVSREQARAEIFESLEGVYPRVRRHSSSGFVSPAEYERTRPLAPVQRPDISIVG